MRNILVVLFLLGSLTAWSAETTVPNDKPVAVPHSDLQLPAVEHVSTESKTELEFGASNWKPKELSPSTHLKSYTKYSSGPLMSIVLSPGTLYENARFQIHSRLGISYWTANRRGEMSINGQSLAVSEDVSLYSAKLGVGISGPAFFSRLKSYLNLHAVPSLLLVPSSEFSSGQSHAYFSFEEELGLRLRINSLRSSKSISFNVGGQFTQAVRGPLTGYGVYSSLQVSL